MRQFKSTAATVGRALLGRPPRHATGFDGDDGISKEEADKLKRSISEKDREVRDLKKESKERDDKIAELEQKIEEASSGDDDEKKALEKRLDRLEKQGTEAKERAEKAEQDLADSKRESTALAVAARLGFKNPNRAIRLLDSDDIDTEDDAERALEQLAREEPGMVSSKKTRPVDDPAKKKKGGKDEDEDDDDPAKKKGGSDEDEPVGVDRLRRHYAEAEKKGEGDDEGSEDSD